jgi:5-methylcytosine-specific restriction endonuclease McrA
MSQTIASTRSWDTHHFVSKFTETLHSGARSSKLKLTNENALYNAITAGGQSKWNPANMDSTCKKSWQSVTRPWTVTAKRNQCLYACVPQPAFAPC